MKLTLLMTPFTSTEAGTVTALLLLARLTVNPPLPSVPLSANVQVTFPLSHRSAGTAECAKGSGCSGAGGKTSE